MLVNQMSQSDTVKMAVHYYIPIQNKGSAGPVAVQIGG